MAAALELIRATNTLLSPVAPAASGWVAERLFTSPRRHKPPAREARAEELGERVRFGPGLSALRFGRGRGSGSRGRILAMHGWEGRATQWGALAFAAAEAGYELIAIDAPGHGRSPGKRADPRTFLEGLLAADEAFGPFEAVVGHSIGGATTALALSRGLRARRAVLIASPASPERVMRSFAGAIGLSESARTRFYERMERHVGLPPDALDLPDYELGMPILVVHSRDDRAVEFRSAERLVEAWPGARLAALEGLGHYRVMRSPETVDRTLDFIADEARS